MYPGLSLNSDPFLRPFSNEGLPGGIPEPVRNETPGLPHTNDPHYSGFDALPPNQNLSDSALSEEISATRRPALALFSPGASSSEVTKEPVENQGKKTKKGR